MISVLQCQRCGEEFNCGIQAGKESCWCFELPVLKNVPAVYQSCLCQRCLGHFAGVTESPEFKEGEDFYYEKGLMVFTAAYHLKRGVCCGSGCRHCPY